MEREAVVELVKTAAMVGFMVWVVFCLCQCTPKLPYIPAL